jgi:hypothetical protein
MAWARKNGEWVNNLDLSIDPSAPIYLPRFSCKSPLNPGTDWLKLRTGVSIKKIIHIRI